MLIVNEFVHVYVKLLNCFIQKEGRRVTCVAYDIEPSVDAIRHPQLA